MLDAAHDLRWDSPAGLTSRELEVLHLAATGMRNAHVAAELGVSIHAVKFHLASVYRKLGVSNRTEAAAVYHASHARSAVGRSRDGA